MLYSAIPPHLLNLPMSWRARLRALLRILAIAIVIRSQLSVAAAADSFRFESMQTLDDMRHMIEARFPLGTSRESLRRTFIEEGHATLKLHPTQAGIEKYIYDINLCSYYVWRWNISADYNSAGHLLQAYLNGNPVFPAGTPLKKVQQLHNSAGKAATIYKAKRARPEAYKGDRVLSFLLYDADSDLNTTDDQLLIGSGPSRVDPINMGKMTIYTNVDPWRSIFDLDDAEHMASFDGDCAQVDSFMTRHKSIHSGSHI